uniref:Vesicle transport through interaction with t-SNAREs 1 n=1 Tax=Tetraselmis sp. GSL018 TaxID=582737 RepID=A0A061QTF3_9CHLO|mmetsp:Transcript_42700/g.101379  ORF Transcript_42700/g.101379 Transcript_42700/m.101379 type:complete len:224 (-) Transcript_42700:82-753(-)
MSQIFEQYEVELQELEASLDSKLEAIPSLSGELRSSKVAELGSDIAEAEALLRRMELEARSLTGEHKTILMSRMREHKTRVSKKKSDVKAASTAGSAGDAVRAELGLSTGSYTSSSASQRERLLSSTERLNQSSERIRQGRQTLLQTEELGASILGNLHQQRETINRAHGTLYETDDNIGRARKLLGVMSRRVTTNKVIMGLIILILVVCIFIVLYCKVFSHC